VTFDISGNGSLGKFTGAFGVSVAEDAACATDKGWYQTKNVCLFTDASSLSLTWIVPDDVKESITPDGKLMLGFWWSDQASITLNSVSVRYSNSTGTTTTTTASNTSGTVSSVAGAVPTSEEVNSMSSAEIVENISVGWNLGNTLDSYNTTTSDTEIGWGNPKTTKAMFQAVQDAGFNAVRIPVTWGEHMSEDGTIDADWMARVKEVVDYAYDLGLYVILNVHHDDYLWLTPTSEKLESDQATLTKIWGQICSQFQDYDHRLIFEGMNEPRVVGSAEEWTGGTQESYTVINQLFQAFVDTVRASGGMNTDRTVIVTTYAQSAEKNAVSGLVVPNDSHVIVSLHIYAPWKFCGNEDSDADWGTDADKAELDETFQYLSDTFISKGIPVIIDECGAVNKNENTSARAAWYGYYISAAKKQGIKCFIWDNGEKADGFALLDRENCTWYYPEIVQAIQNAVK
jgi:aryl-phospho-beta-D-glucosidase BglC (GH1 family)